MTSPDAVRPVAPLHCPPAEDLRAVAALQAESAVERRVRAHGRDCAACAARLQEDDPAALLIAGLPWKTLPEPAWQEVMRAVEREIEAHPRRRRQDGLLGALQRLLENAHARPLSALAAASLLVVVGLTAALLAARGAGVPGEAVLRHRPEAAARIDSSALATGFVYLSNPDAQVAHVLVSGTGGEAPVQVTMVIDATLTGELFP